MLHEMDSGKVESSVQNDTTTQTIFLEVSDVSDKMDEKRYRSIESVEACWYTRWHLNQ